MTLTEFLNARLEEDEAAAKAALELVLSGGLFIDPETLLRVLASVYSDHPDYDPAWTS